MIDTQKFWTKGNQDVPVCILVDHYSDKVLCDVEAKHLTSDQFQRAIEAEFPEFAFQVWAERGYWFATGKRRIT